MGKYLRRTVAGFAATVIMCIALLMPGGVYQVAGETLFEPAIAVSTFKPAIAVSTFKPPIAVSTFKPTMAVSTFEPAIAVSTFKPMLNVEYLRCGTLKGFNNRKKCVFEVLDIPQEGIDRAAEEYNRAIKEGKM